MAETQAPPRLEGRIRLPDGRSLACAQYGELEGPPVIYFHGTPGSRLEHPPAIGTGTAGRVRLIVPDRPGYGLSDFHPGRRLLDWPLDVARLADALGLERFAVVGVSGGGPHAAACAYALSDRLTGAALISSLAPVDRPGGLEHLSPWVRAAFRLGRWAPWSLRPLIWLMSNPRRDPERFFLANTERLCPSDRRLLTRPEVRRMLAEDFREAGRQGVRAYAQDVTLFSRPWGFALQAITMPVSVWHGECDTILPPRMGRYLAETIPRARVRFVPDGGHFLALNYLDGIVESLDL
ncbi:MAG: alpha/beta hydrolase [Anaerolineae bacterium]|nr:alpha/beta hydrolase [Anaerolineae bacterium]